MCGIAGIAAGGQAPDRIRRTLERMTSAVAHRGPDDEGYFVEEGVGLGMRRLSIIDVDGGGQPIANEDGSVHVVFNGEIYNFESLRDELRRAGHVFRTDSDTETIVHAYEEHGETCVDRLRGMFAFALWDERNRKLVLAVDRLGIKPLYYRAREGGVVFGSELKAVLASGRVDDAPDFEALGQYFSLGFIGAPRTAFAGVAKLAPGHLLRWTSRDGAVTRRYWDVPPSEATGEFDPNRARRELRRRLAEAVHSHLVSDVPLGAFLSGGVDSSSVVALMSEGARRPVKTFSIGFSDPRYSELDAARLVARRFGTDHHELVVEPESVDVLPKLADHFDEPFADSSALPTYFVSKMAREHVKVALSGDGGDELFFGYTIFRGVDLARRAQAIPEGVRNRLMDVAGALPGAQRAIVGDRLSLFGKRLGDTMLPPDEAYVSKLVPPGLKTVRALLSGEFRDLLSGSDPFFALGECIARYPNGGGRDDLGRFAYATLKTVLPGDMLTKVDRMSMANSLEVRVPLLDHELAEFVSTIPVAGRFGGWRLKALLKDAMSDVLPARVLAGRKKGFAVPLAAWFRDDLAGYATDILLDASTIDSGYLDAAGVERMLKRHRAGEMDVSGGIWALLMFELWRRGTAATLPAESVRPSIARPEQAAGTIARYEPSGEKPQTARLKVLMLAPHSGVPGPLPKHTPHLVSALADLGCDVTTEGWGRHSGDQALAARAVGRLTDIAAIRRRAAFGRFDVAVVKTGHDWATLMRDILLVRAVRPHCGKMVVQFHGSRADWLARPGHRLFKAATRLLLRDCDAAMVLSSEERRCWRDFAPGTKFHLVSNPVSQANEAGPDRRTRRGRRAGVRPVFLFVGRLVREKGIFDLLDAVEMLGDEVPWDLVIAGDGAGAAEVKEHTLSLGLAARVTFAGYLGDKELSRAYTDADALVLPSWSEGFPTVVSEAMMAGLPIITTRLRGMADHLANEENALFVPPRDPAALAEAMRRLSSDAVLRGRLSRANRLKVKEFAPDVVGKRYLEVLEDVAEAA